MSRSGIVNVRMVITEEKILSNIDRVQKLINPKSKKQIIQLEEDAYFKDLIESIKTYLVEYPKKKNFPASVYKAAYDLIEYATNQFEDNTKKIEDLIKQREVNINLAANLKEVLTAVENKEDGWKKKVEGLSSKFADDIIETLNVIGKTKPNKQENCKNEIKLINARIANLEANLHIEIDMERIEDRSKALSYIGIEVADALKLIPTPQGLDLDPVKEIHTEETVESVENVETIENIEENSEVKEYLEETRIEVKPTLWQRIKNSKLVRAISYITKIRITLEKPDALPEGRGE